MFSVKNMKKCFFLLVLGFIPVSGQAECSFKLRNGRVLVFRSADLCEAPMTDGQGNPRAATSDEKAGCTEFISKSKPGERLVAVKTLCNKALEDHQFSCNKVFRDPNLCPTTKECECKNLGSGLPPGAVPSPPGPPSGGPGPSAGPVPGGSSGGQGPPAAPTPGSPPGVIWPELGESTIKNLEDKSELLKEKIRELLHHKTWFDLANRKCTLENRIDNLQDNEQKRNLEIALEKFIKARDKIILPLRKLYAARPVKPKRDDYVPDKMDASYISALNEYVGKLKRYLGDLERRTKEAFRQLEEITRNFEKMLNNAKVPAAQKEGCSK